MLDVASESRVGIIAGVAAEPALSVAARSSEIQRMALPCPRCGAGERTLAAVQCHRARGAQTAGSRRLPKRVTCGITIRTERRGAGRIVFLILEFGAA